MPAPNLSVILITRDEAANVAACLASTASFADEWIVVDAASSDATAALARAAGARVIEAADWPGFGAQKNRALAEARGRWVFSIDADERVTPELAAEIRRAVDADAAVPVAYSVSRLSNFCGRWMRHGDWYPDRVVRLFRRGAARFSDDRVHERLVVDGPTGRLAGELLHASMPALEPALDKLNRYSSGRALDRHRAGSKGGLGRALAHGSWAFFRCYILRRGLLDGALGLALAIYVAEGTYYRYLKIGLLARPPRPPFA